ncbi:MAG: DUF1289 domain-containing protein [Alphaproteobacteria bacterium]
MAAPIVTPCIRVCRIDPKTRICAGCNRSLAEIAAWSALTPSERDAIMADLPSRPSACKT